MTTVVDYLFPFPLLLRIPPAAPSPRAGPTPRAAPSRVFFLHASGFGPLALGFRVPHTFVRTRATSRALSSWPSDARSRSPSPSPRSTRVATADPPASAWGAPSAARRCGRRARASSATRARAAGATSRPACTHQEALHVAVETATATLSAAGAGGPGPPSIASRLYRREARLLELGAQTSQLVLHAPRREQLAGDPRYFTTTSFASPSFICDTA